MHDTHRYVDKINFLAPSDGTEFSCIIIAGTKKMPITDSFIVSVAYYYKEQSGHPIGRKTTFIWGMYYFMSEFDTIELVVPVIREAGNAFRIGMVINAAMTAFTASPIK